MSPATEKHDEDDHDAPTVPSGVHNVPPDAPSPSPSPAEPVVTVEASPPRPFPIAYAVALIIGTPLLALCIATTVEFLDQMAGDFAAAYAWSVVLSSAALGAVVALVAVKVRGMRT